MTDNKQSEIFSYNLKKMLRLSGKSQKEVADAIGISPQTFNTWCQGIALPRMGKLQMIADYFGVNKSDLIELKPTPAASALFSEEACIIAQAYDDADSVDQEMVRRILKVDVDAPKKEDSAG